MKLKRVLATLLAVAMVFAVAAPAALATDTIPITADQSLLIAMTTYTTVRPVNPSQVSSYNITYEITSGVGTISTTTESMTYNGITYSNVPVATVMGLVAGTLVVTAKIGSLSVGTTTITVRSKLATGTATITAGSTLLTYGSTTQLVSSSGYSVVACSSSDSTYFPVTNAGVVTCKIPSTSIGYADITAYDSAGNYGIIRIFGGSFPTNTVSAAKSAIAINESLQLYLDGYPNHCGSSNPAVATVTDAGVVKGISSGSAIIYCINSTTGSVGQYTVTVGSGSSTSTGSVALLKSTIAPGESTILYGSGITILTSYSSNSAVATASGYTVTGVAAGTALITYVTSTGGNGQLTLTVSSSSTTTDSSLPTPTKSYSISVGGTKTFKYTGASVAEAWTANSSVATATLVTGSDGYKQARYTGVSAGTTTIYMKNASGTVSAFTLVVSAGDVTGKTGKISSGDDDLRVSVRKGAASTYDRLATLSNGTSVTIAGESGVYYKITFTSSGKTYTGYVKKAYITIS